MEMKTPRLTEAMSAYDYLRGPLVDAIREEPARIRMADWLRTDRDAAERSRAWIVGHWLDGGYDAEDLGDYGLTVADVAALSAPRWPACDTVGCVAGWTVAMIRPSLIGRVVNGYSFDVRDGAKGLLGLVSREQASELFEPSHLVRDPQQGQPAHAERVVAHILDFTDRYADQLRAQWVEPEPAEAQP